MLAFTLEFDAFNQAIWILGSLKKFHALYDLLINHLFICETKALKLDLTILLVHREPNEQQQILKLKKKTPRDIFATQSQVTLLRYL